MNKFLSAESEERSTRSTRFSKGLLASGIGSDMGFRILPSVKIIGFKNFIPMKDDQPILEPNQEQQTFQSLSHISQERSKSKSKSPIRDFSPMSVFSNNREGPECIVESRKGSFLSKLEDIISVGEMAQTVPELEIEKGPFMIFVISGFSENGTPVIVEELKCLKIEFDMQQDLSNDSGFLDEHSPSFHCIRLRENESVLIIPEKAFLQSMQNNSLDGEQWHEIGLQKLKEKVEILNSKLTRKQQVAAEDLLSLESLKKDIYGETLRGFHKTTQISYTIRTIDIKTPHTMALVLNELDVLEKVLNVKNKSFVNIYDIKVFEGTQNVHTSLEIISEFGFGTLEEFARFRHGNGQEWREEELLMITMDLLNQFRTLKDLNVLKRNIKPSEIIVRRDFKGLSFFDFGLSQLITEELSGIEIIGTPKYMSPELKFAIQRNTFFKHSETQAELFSIGSTIFSLILALEDNSELDKSELVSIHNIETVSKKYPILWKKYLKHLVDSEPKNRENALRAGISGIKDFMFFEKEHKDFESYCAESIFQNNKSPLVQYKIFLPYLWNLKNYTLIAEMKACIIQEFYENPSLFRKAKKFLEKLAALYEKDAKYIESALTLEKLVEIVEKFMEIKEHKKVDYDRLLSEVHSKIGSLYKIKEKYNKALENFEKAVFIEFMTGSEDQAHVIKNYFEMAEVYEKLNQDVLALSTYEKVQGILNELYKGTWDHLDEANLCKRLGKIYLRQRRYQEALEKIEKAKLNYCICYGEIHSMVIECHYWLGKIYSEMKEDDKAIQNYEIYCQAKYSDAKEFESETAVLFEYIANYLESQEKYAEALEHYEKALHIYEQNDDEEGLCAIYEKIGESYAKQKKYLIAVKNFRLCYQTKIATHGKKHMILVPIIEKLADYLVKEGENKQALDEYSHALKIINAQPREDKSSVNRIMKKIEHISPLVFLAYRNYSRGKAGSSRSTSPSQTEISLLIGWESINQVKGVLEKAEADMSLAQIRSEIEKECSYLSLFKYNFMQKDTVINISQEKQLCLKDCLIKKEGYNYVVIKESGK